MTTHSDWTATISGPGFIGDQPTRDATLDGGGTMMVPVQVTFEFDKRGLAVDLVLDVEDGRPVTTSITTRRLEGGPPIEMLSTEVARGLKTRDLMAHAVPFAMLEPVGPGKFKLGAQDGPALEAAIKSTRARRLPMSDERLRLTAAAYRKGGLPAVEDIPGWQVARRQAQRAVEAAIKRGFLNEGERR